ncbi:MAG: 3-hydroxyacyl-CoA dehydrogenase [Actinobacteria bacterium]|nr:MAG: 3-hydroxyacyl-CoA dehydrogenase [Actinomycetota bacterium]
MAHQSTLPPLSGGADDFGRQPTSGKLLGDPEHATRAITLAVLEVLAGRRPARQLNKWVSNAVAARVRAQATVGSGPVGRRPPRVGSVHCQQPIDGIVESTLIVWEEGRCRAIAVRLEGLDGRWQCTAFEDPH